MSIKGHTRDECVRLKVGPNVRIPGKWSEFLRDSTNKVELFKYLLGEVMQPFHSGGDIYITMSNGTTGGHVGPGEDMTTVCNQEEADTRIILHISLKNRISVNYSALNCLFSSIMIKTPSSDVIVILIHHLHHFNTISTGATSRWITGSGRNSESSTSENLHVLWEFNAMRLSPSSWRSLDATQRLPWRGALRECVSLHGRSVRPVSHNAWWSCWTAHSNICR